MADDKKRFTESVKCGHCQNEAPMEVVGDYSGVQSHADEASGYMWDAGLVFEMVKCPACSDITLRRYTYHDAMDPSDIEFQVLYPTRERALRGLPKQIESGYHAAQRVRSIDANA